MSDSPQMTKRRPLLAAEAAEATPYSLVVEGVPQFSSTRRALPRLRAALSYVSAGLLFAIFVLYMLPANLALVERPPQTGAACARDRMYTKRTLKALHDAPVGALLSYEALLGERKFEASDVISYGDHYYVVCDSSWAILRVHKSMPLLSAANAQIGAPQDGYEEGDSGFEALVHDATSDSIYVVRESVQAAPAGGGGAKAVSTRAARAIAGEDDDDDAGGAAASAVSWLLSGGQSAAKEAPAGAYHAMVYQLGFEGGLTTATNYSVVDACPSEMEFEGDSKGFEGATSIRGKDGTLYLLGLCEGNHCREGAAGKEAGNGRIVVMAREETKEGDDGQNSCRWKTVTTLELPPTAAFIDYSAIALHHSTKTVAVTSQENSQVWIGALSGGANGDFVPEEAKFEEGKVYDFPRDANCNLQYCNIEGIHWVEGGGPGTPQVLVGVSDKMKSKGKQSFTCGPKDQSVHLFALP